MLEQAECDTVDRACVRETGRTGSLVNRSDLVRLWVAAGCPIAPEQLTGFPPKASLFAAMDALAESQPPGEDEEDGGAAPPPITTPEQAKEAADLAAARAGRTPIPKPGEKKK
jgi:hypothetical protein